MKLNIFFAILLAIVMSGCIHAPLQQQSPPLAPRKNWRALPIAVALSSTENGTLHPLLTGETGSIEIAPGDEHWIAVELPPNRERPVMLTYRQPDRKVSIRTIWEQSDDSTSGYNGTWEVVEERDVRYFLDKVEVAPDAPQWVRLRFEARDGWPEDEPVRFTDIGLYEIDPDGRNDYWLIIGASIQQQSIENHIFHEMVTERHPDYDPVMFNLAVSGWRTGNLLNALPSFLARHPNASYVGIHIGGNNVSANRPYPGGAEELEEDLIAILEMIQEAGMTPILSRLSYRAYHPSATKGAVPPDENGAGPYVENIFDPLIQQYCPAFVDEATGLGVVDAYNYFRAYTEELSPDGIHVNPTGERSWNRLWAEGAGRVVYGD